MAASMGHTSLGETVTYHVPPTDLTRDMTDSDAEWIEVGSGTAVRGITHREVVMLMIDGHVTWLAPEDAVRLGRTLQSTAGLEVLSDRR